LTKSLSAMKLWRVVMGLLPMPFQFGGAAKVIIPTDLEPR
jgi:hypothetical protein